MNGNGEIPSTGDPRVDEALNRLRQHYDARFKDFEDAALVQAYLEKKSGERLKEHAQLLVEHSELLAKHHQMQVEHSEWMKHFQDKLDALTNILMRRSGGTEALQ